jgi:proteasome alpha subunit
VRAADLKGYQFSRHDVDARGLANQYAQILGQTFTHDMKPLEVEILVAEVGFTVSGDRLFHIMYDGTVLDEQHFCVLGGDAESIRERLTSGYTENGTLSQALKIARSALRGTDQEISVADLEVAVLERNGKRRCFSRLNDDAVTRLLN